MAMGIRRYDAEHIAQCGRSRATLALDATGCCHRAIICPVLPPADAMVIDFGLKNQLGHCEIAFQN
jgi:hypothetical protein